MPFLHDCLACYGFRLASCEKLATYGHVAHDSESNDAMLEENFLSHLHRYNSLDLYNIDVWSLILTFCKKKKKETISCEMWPSCVM